jgi:methyltransferase (TIGR00027 family)
MALKPISKTAFYCTGVRALDARRPTPVAGDVHAERFLDEAAWKVFEPFRGLTGANTSNVVRHRILDDLLRSRLAADPSHRVVTVGAGFDSRPFRLSGGDWIEVDEPQVIAWKEERLPAGGSPNPLRRIAVDFDSERLADRLAFAAGPEETSVVVEGVLMYLGEVATRELLRSLAGLFPRLEILCDVMTTEFFDRFAGRIHRRIRDLGATFRLPARPLAEIFAEEGFAERERISILTRSYELGVMPWWGRLAHRFSRSFRDGYSIRAFERRERAG